MGAARAISLISFHSAFFLPLPVKRRRRLVSLAVFAVFQFLSLLTAGRGCWEALRVLVQDEISAAAQVGATVILTCILLPSFG